MLWSKQYYYFDVDKWLDEHEAHPLLGPGRDGVRNTEWFHMLNSDIISMPDKWEYPWYAAWDLAFHTIAPSLVDFDFAKEQLLLMLRSLYAHPNGQIPAYEWNFSDVNPPVHAWATFFLFNLERDLGRTHLRFLERSFQGLLLNFNWWVNRKDPEGRNVFAGGFLGLDNIGVFDRSAPLPAGGHLDQADGTAWMAFYCQNMLQMALVLAERDPMYEEIWRPRLAAVCNKEKLERILRYMLDEREFLSPFGIRSLSRYHLEHPFQLQLDGQDYSVQYLPAESNNGMFGGNSNWRGPIWMPINGLLVRGLLVMYTFYGDDFKVECPTGSGNYMTPFEVAREVRRRLSNIFLRDAGGRRAVYGGMARFQNDPYWRDSSCSTSISTATTAPGWARVIRRDGRV